MHKVGTKGDRTCGDTLLWSDNAHTKEISLLAVRPQLHGRSSYTRRGGWYESEASSDVCNLLPWVRQCR